MLSIAEDLRLAYPGAAFGVLVMTRVSNPPFHAGLEERKRRVEEELRGRFAGMTRAELNSVEPLGAYAAYYGRFKQTYHVLLQLESVVHGGRPIPSVAALVEAMFLAELRNLLLTAGHNLAELSFPLRLGLAEGMERYLGLDGREKTAVRGDMLLADGRGAISSVLRGPDHRTRLKEDTGSALFFVYAPPGIGTAPLRAHLSEIREYVQLVAPGAEETTLETVEVR
ncbi:MAG: hypothetical protein NUW23_10670 [Firmicutes bacterium]|jgi:DNA/RNA-binding domain of Phe-tRNA-synthetase-like protein|nr:hypothetical protein [Bacillota bacterium]